MAYLTMHCNLLMIEDNPADVRLMIEAIREAELDSMVTARYAYDGEEAFALLESAYNQDENISYDIA